MADNAESVLMQLITQGYLMVGTTLVCGMPGRIARVAPDGLDIEGQIFADPTAAMRHVLGCSHPADNGWAFWKLEDADVVLPNPWSMCGLPGVRAEATRRFAPA